MMLSQNKYELIDYLGEDEFPVVGNITMRDGKFCCAEVIDSVITNVDELNRVREFLGEVEMKMHMEVD